MKAAFVKFKTTAKALWADESAQGATEYILLLVVVVGLALAFKPKITQLLNDKMDAIKTDVGGFTSNG